MKRDGGGLFTISRALNGLVGGLVNSLEEFQNVGSALEVEIAAGYTNCSLDEPLSSVNVEAKPEHLLVIADALKAMVGRLVSDIKASIKADVEVQKFLVAMQKCNGVDHHAFFQDLITSNQPSCLVDVSPSSEDMPVRSFSNDARMVKRAAGKGKGKVVCRHVCEHHPEIVVVDRWLWRKLPLEIVELVFSKLPLDLIIHLRNSSGAWNALSKSRNFGEAYSKKHPHLYGLMGWDSENNERIYVRVHDIEGKSWEYVSLATIPETLPGYCKQVQISEELWVRDYRNNGYRNSMYACDGGLVCFVPYNVSLISYPILVCNPLTSVWKTLPLIPLDDLENATIMMVQLVVEDDTKCYEVILVIHEQNEEALAAHFYSSKTGIWSIMDCGLVYGVDSRLMSGSQLSVPYVFDCATKMMFDLTEYASFDNYKALAYSMAKDHLFVLYRSDSPLSVWDVGFPRVEYKYVISEYIWESGISDLKELNYSESNVQFFPRPYIARIFASRSFVLLFVDNCVEGLESHHQLTGLCDVSANEWSIPPPFHYLCSEEMTGCFMCELRWDITP